MAGYVRETRNMDAVPTAEDELLSKWRLGVQDGSITDTFDAYKLRVTRKPGPDFTDTILAAAKKKSNELGYLRAMQPTLLGSPLSLASLKPPTLLGK